MEKQYQVLARKYRPQNFSELVGQPALVQTLSNEIKNNKIHHAFILTGIRGIYPVLNSLVRHGLVENAEPVTRDFTNNKGETKPKDYKTYRLTEFGRKFSVNN